MRFTVVTNAKGPLGKAYEFRNGGLHKTSFAELYAGWARKVEVKSLAQFAEGRARLKAHQALMYGVAAQVNIGITTQAMSKVGAIPRDNQHFDWPRGPGIWFIDHDPALGTSYAWQELDAIFCAQLPELQTAARLWTPSSSAFIRRGEDVLIGRGGWRCYVHVECAPEIPQLTEALFQRLVAAGYGYTLITRNGRRLLKTLIDKSVAQPCRLDFVTPTLGVGLERFGQAELIEGKPLANFHPEQCDWQAEAERLKAAAQDEAREMAARYVTGKVVEAVARGENPKEARRKWSRLAGESEFLGPDNEIWPTDLARCTVQDILDNPEFYDEKRCADPAEPSYRDDDRIAIIYAHSGIIYSHAHGGVTYRLLGPDALEILMESLDDEI